MLTEVYNPKKSTLTNKSAEVTAELVTKVTSQVKPQLEAEITELVLAELRAEIKKVREEVALSVQTAVDKNSAETTSDVTDELASKITTQVKPKLEAEITDFVLDELHVEIKKAREEIVSSTQNFVDKSKADLKTELPQMYQDSVNLAEINLNEKFDSLQTLQEELVASHQTALTETLTNLQKTVGSEIQEALRDELSKMQEKAIHDQEVQLQDHQAQLNEALDGFLQIKGEKAEKTLMQKMQEYQETMRISHQEKLTEEMTTALGTLSQRVEESTLEQIGVMHSQVGTLQQESFAKLREAFNAEKEDVFNKAAIEIKDTLALQMTEQGQEISDQFLSKVSGSLPEVQTILQENIQSILADAIPDLEGRLRNELTADLQQLLLNVKFVLPE